VCRGDKRSILIEWQTLVQLFYCQRNHPCQLNSPVLVLVLRRLFLSEEQSYNHTRIRIRINNKKKKGRILASMGVLVVDKQRNVRVGDDCLWFFAFGSLFRRWLAIDVVVSQ